MPTFPVPNRFLTVVAGAALLAACGGGTSSPETASTTSTTAPAAATQSGDPTVTIERSRFGPIELEVAAGTTVTFVNVDPYAHTVTSSDGSTLEFDSTPFGQDETFEQTFAEPGTYAYFCEIHPTMQATVIVG